MSFSYTFYSTNNPIMVIALFVLLILDAITLYSLAKDAGYDSIAWLAFIPIGSWILRFKMADWSGWTVIILLIPYLNIIGAVVFLVAVYSSYKNTSSGSAGLYLMLCIFGLGFIANILARKKVRGRAVW